MPWRPFIDRAARRRSTRESNRGGAPPDFAYKSQSDFRLYVVTLPDRDKRRYYTKQKSMGGRNSVICTPPPLPLIIAGLKSHRSGKTPLG